MRKHIATAVAALLSSLRARHQAKKLKAARDISWA